MPSLLLIKEKPEQPFLYFAQFREVEESHQGSSAQKLGDLEDLTEATQATRQWYAWHCGPKRGGDLSKEQRLQSWWCGHGPRQKSPWAIGKGPSLSTKAPPAEGLYALPLVCLSPPGALPPFPNWPFSVGVLDYPLPVVFYVLPEELTFANHIWHIIVSIHCIKHGAFLVSRPTPALASLWAQMDNKRTGGMLAFSNYQNQSGIEQKLTAQG